MTEYDRYQTDILGEDYQQARLNFPDDYEGQVTATLVQKKPIYPRKKQCYIFMALSIISFKRKWPSSLINMALTFMRLIYVNMAALTCRTNNFIMCVSLQNTMQKLPKP